MTYGRVSVNVNAKPWLFSSAITCGTLQQWLISVVAFKKVKTVRARFSRAQFCINHEGRVVYTKIVPFALQYLNLLDTAVQPLSFMKWSVDKIPVLSDYETDQVKRDLICESHAANFEFITIYHGVRIVCELFALSLSSNYYGLVTCRLSGHTCKILIGILCELYGLNLYSVI